METDEHTPVPRSRRQERHDTTVRLAKVIVGPLMAALVSIAVAYFQRSSDKTDVDNKAKAVEQKVDNAKAAADKAIDNVKKDIAVVSNAAQPVAQLAVETHEDVVAKGSKRRARATDPKLLQKVQASIRDLKKVEAKVSPKSNAAPAVSVDAGAKPDGQAP